MVKKKGDRCGNCHWWLIRTITKDMASTGSCLRYPPQMRKLDIIGNPEPGSWSSVTWEFELCGEYKYSKPLDERR